MLIRWWTVQQTLPWLIYLSLQKGTFGLYMSVSVTTGQEMCMPNSLFLYLFLFVLHFDMFHLESLQGGASGFHPPILVRWTWCPWLQRSSSREPSTTGWWWFCEGNFVPYYSKNRKWCFGKVRLSCNMILPIITTLIKGRSLLLWFNCRGSKAVIWPSLPEDLGKDAGNDVANTCFENTHLKYTLSKKKKNYGFSFRKTLKTWSTLTTTGLTRCLPT